MPERLAPEHHDSLPDILEPQENPALFGHAEAASFVAVAHRAGKLHHALLLTGPPGIGKATLAFHIARHLLSHPESGTAPSTLTQANPRSTLFRLVAQDAHPSVLHLTRPWNERDKKWKTVLAVDEIRRIGQFLSLRAHDGGWRIVIVDPADDLQHSAANALLKNLEEPSARVLFILVAHLPALLLPTIRSRCQVLAMAALAPAEQDQALHAAGFSGGAEAVRTASGGSVREAITLQIHGGLDIMSAADAVIAAPVFDAAQALKVGEVVSGRDNEERFGLFTRHLLDRVAGAAAEAARTGLPDQAERRARLWQQLASRSSETVAYGLDRKQHVFDALLRVRAELTG